MIKEDFAADNTRKAAFLKIQNYHMQQPCRILSHQFRTFQECRLQI